MLVPILDLRLIKNNICFDARPSTARLSSAYQLGLHLGSLRLQLTEKLSSQHQIGSDCSTHNYRQLGYQHPRVYMHGSIYKINRQCSKNKNDILVHYSLRQWLLDLESMGQTVDAKFSQGPKCPYGSVNLVDSKRFPFEQRKLQS